MAIDWGEPNASYNTTPTHHERHEGVPNGDEIAGSALFLLVTHVREERASDETLASLARNPTTHPLSALISGTCASSFSSFVYCFRPPGQLVIWSRHWGRPNKDGQKDVIMPSDATSFHACLSCYGELARLHLALESAQLYAFNFTQRIPKSYKILLPWSSYTFKLLFRFMDGWLIFRYFTIACRGFKLFSANYILGLIRSLQNSVSANVLIFVLQEKVRVH